MFDKDLFIEMMDDHQVYHSNFQMDHFIVEKHGFTDYGMYKQSLRELYERFNELKRSIGEFELLKIDIKQIEAKRLGNAVDKKRLEIDESQKRSDARSIGKSIEHRIRELVRIYFQAASLKKKIGTLTTERRDQLEEEMWVFRIKKMAAMEYASHRSVSVNTIENVLCLPMKHRKELFETIMSSPGLLLDWISTIGFSKYTLEDYEVKEVDVEYIRGMLYAANGIRDAVITRIKDTSLCELLEDYETRQRSI